jgi:hypothetical protein
MLILFLFEFELVRFDAPSNPIGIFRHFAVVILLQLEHKADIIVAVARRNVEMKMENGLSRHFSVVRKDVESGRLERAHERPRDDVRRRYDVREFLLGDVKKRFAVPFREYEDVTVVNRIDIEDCECVRIPKQNLRRRFTANNGAEGAFVDRQLILTDIPSLYTKKTKESQ